MKFLIANGADPKLITLEQPKEEDSGERKSENEFTGDAKDNENDFRRFKDCLRSFGLTV
jgi:hypothetical protein